MSIEMPGPDAAQAEESAPALDRALLDGFALLAKRVAMTGHSIARGFGVTPPDLFALSKIEGELPMKELAQRMGVDASFVTAIADTLENRGLARREPSKRDRRVKNLVLTPEGAAVKERLLDQLAVKLPWCYALGSEERRCFLGLLRKMLNTPEPAARSEMAALTELTELAEFCDEQLPGAGPARQDGTAREDHAARQDDGGRRG